MKSNISTQEAPGAKLGDSRKHVTFLFRLNDLASQLFRAAPEIGQIVYVSIIAIFSTHWGKRRCRHRPNARS